MQLQLFLVNYFERFYVVFFRQVSSFDTQMPVVIFVTLLEQKNLILRGFSVLIHIKECIIIVDSIFKNKIVDIQAFPAVIITTQKRDGFSQVIKKWNLQSAFNYWQ